MKKKSLFMFMIAALAVFLMTGCGSSGNEAASGSTAVAEGPEEINFVLDWTPNTNHIGVYVADALGYYEEAGMKVNIQQPPDDGAEALVGSGNAQFGVSFQDTMSSLLEGKQKAMPITAVAAVIQHNTSGIMSAKETGIERPKDMEGHTYATWEWPIEQGIIKKVMEDDGGDYSKLKLIPQSVDDEVAALKTGKIESIWVYYGWAGVAAEVKDYPINYFAFRDISPEFDYYSPVIIANDAYLEQYPEQAKAFVAATARGYEYAAEHPDEAADILCKAVPELDSELAHASAEYLADKYIDDASQWGKFDADRWNAFYTFINENKLYSKEEVALNVGFTNDYLPEVEAEEAEDSASEDGSES